MEKIQSFIDVHKLDISSLQIFYNMNYYKKQVSRFYICGGNK
jgi:hypothetical protein